MNFAARLGCTAVGLRPPSVAPQTRLKPTTETRQRSTYKKAKAVQTNGATSGRLREAPDATMKSGFPDRPPLMLSGETD